MGKVLNEIGSTEEKFIANQKVFFVATAPLSREHYVNLSPKAPGSSLVVLGPQKVAFADLCGSGCETAAHVMENGRMTIMLCNLEEGPPKILRFHGTAEVIVRELVDESLLQKFPESLTQNPGFRSVFVMAVERISSSCGYSLPVMTYQNTRSTLNEYSERKGSKGMDEYCLQNNSFSIDGLASVAQLRFPDVTIVPKPEGGYVHAALVEKASSPLLSAPKLVSYHRSSNHHETSKTKSIILSALLGGTFLFVTGTLFGLLVLPHLLKLEKIDYCVVKT